MAKATGNDFGEKPMMQSASANTQAENHAPSKEIQSGGTAPNTDPNAEVMHAVNHPPVMSSAPAPKAKPAQESVQNFNEDGKVRLNEVNSAFDNLLTTVTAHASAENPAMVKMKAKIEEARELAKQGLASIKENV